MKSRGRQVPHTRRDVHRRPPGLRSAVRASTARALAAIVAAVALAGGTASAAGGVSREEAIRQLDNTRRSVDETLALIKGGDAEQALQQARDGYLSHFELVETPLRVVDNDLTIKTEFQFADDPHGDLRRQAGRRDPRRDHRAARPARRGRAQAHRRRRRRAGARRRPVVPHPVPRGLRGRPAARRCCSATWRRRAARSTSARSSTAWRWPRWPPCSPCSLMPTIFGLFPVGREVLEAITALLAVAVLFYVSFWLIARLEHKRWMEFVRARLWSAVVGRARPPRWWPSASPRCTARASRPRCSTSRCCRSATGLGWYILLGRARSACVALAGVRVRRVQARPAGCR